MSNIEYITMGNQRDIINKTLRDTYHFVVADRNVFETYKALFVGVDRLFVFESKESTKQMDTVLEIVEYLHKHKFGRHCTLVGIGGGIVGDLVGFVASIYMRGVPFINIPTTLLSQVDSSIGGKTAINARGIKNLLGSFYEAKQIIIDHSFLVTLPEREWLSGVGEIFKTALLNKKLYEYFKKNMSGLVSRDAKVVGEMVEQCVSIKDKIVSLDTKDTGIRKILNLGHTVGHAMESVHQGEYSHGECVLQGILIECSIFADLCEPAYLDEIRDLLRKLIQNKIKILPQSIADAAMHDKKNLDEKIHFVVPVNLGQTKETTATKEEFVRRLKAFAKSEENFVYPAF